MAVEGALQTSAVGQKVCCSVLHLLQEDRVLFGGKKHAVWSCFGALDTVV
jgi:hypothetical protein